MKSKPKESTSRKILRKVTPNHDFSSPQGAALTATLGSYFPMQAYLIHHDWPIIGKQLSTKIKDNYYNLRQAISPSQTKYWIDRSKQAHKELRDVGNERYKLAKHPGKDFKKLQKYAKSLQMQLPVKGTAHGKLSSIDLLINSAANPNPAHLETQVFSLERKNRSLDNPLGNLFSKVRTLKGKPFIEARAVAPALHGGGAPIVAAHEVGHLEQFVKISNLTKKLGAGIHKIATPNRVFSAAYIPAMAGSLLAPIYGAGVLKKGMNYNKLSNEKKKEMHRQSQIAGVLGAGAVPTLLIEADADRRAYRMLRKFKMKPTISNRLFKLGALSSYAMAPAAGIGAYLYYKNKKGK